MEIHSLEDTGKRMVGPRSSSVSIKAYIDLPEPPE